MMVADACAIATDIDDAMMTYNWTVICNSNYYCDKCVVIIVHLLLAVVCCCWI